MSVPEKENKGQEPKKKLGFPAVLKRIASYCAYQERCLSEVKDKLEDYHLSLEESEKIISKLVKENFINEERFAASFVSGRFLIKKWGKVRIRQELKMRSVPNELINMALNQIDDEAYQEILKALAQRKWMLTRENDLLKKKVKVQRFLLFRGFEPELIIHTLDAIPNDI
ncbi:MAG: regulatory protein RecX [Cyclobacteriaceae bacterium]